MTGKVRKLAWKCVRRCECAACASPLRRARRELRGHPPNFGRASPTRRRAAVWRTEPLAAGAEGWSSCWGVPRRNLAAGLRRIGWECDRSMRRMGAPTLSPLLHAHTTRGSASASGRLSSATRKRFRRCLQTPASLPIITTATSLSISSTLERASPRRPVTLVLSLCLPLSPRTVNTAQRVARGTRQARDQHRHWTARCAVRALGGGRAQRIVQERLQEQPSRWAAMLEMWRFEAPGRGPPGIDQHQRRKLRPDVREVGSDLKQCGGAGRLRVT